MNRNRPSGIRQFGIALAVAVAVILLIGNTGWAAKNVILMISDGGGYNTWMAASMYQGKLGKQTYDRPGWQRFGCSTYALNVSNWPTGDSKQDQRVVYDPRKAWDASPLDPKTGGFAGYKYLKKTATDSAAAATALATGRKTYNNSINWPNNDLPLMRGETIAEIAKAHGKSTGVITTVQWSDATPAGLGGAHNIRRNHCDQIANEMLGGGWLDVIMGACNPDFDANGRVLPPGGKRDFQWVGGEETWKALKQGKRGWKLIESKADFEALIAGPTPPRVLGTAQAAKTLQEKRKSLLKAPMPLRAGAAAAAISPFAVPCNQNVPTLATMTKAAINCLDDNPKGFYLMIEGGAVDWANHDHKPDRMIEEQVDFVQAVEAVVDWVEKNSTWDDTLLILTADHECGLLWGLKSDKAAFDPVEDFGPGHLPGMKYNSGDHTNSLVPLYARGPGSGRFAELVKGTDAKAAVIWRFSGQYIDNTDIFTVMKEEACK
jgi:alkaline phosphatase